MDSTSERWNMWDILRIPYLRKRTLIMAFNWCVLLNRYTVHAMFLNSLSLKTCCKNPFFVLVYQKLNSTFDSRFAASLLFYGLSLNIGSFGLNIYLTQLIFAVVEIPANISSLTLSQRFGRRICESCFLFFCKLCVQCPPTFFWYAMMLDCHVLLHVDIWGILRH